MYTVDEAIKRNFFLVDEIMKMATELQYNNEIIDDRHNITTCLLMVGQHRHLLEEQKVSDHINCIAAVMTCGNGKDKIAILLHAFAAGMLPLVADAVKLYSDKNSNLNDSLC